MAGRPVAARAHRHDHPRRRQRELPDIVALAACRKAAPPGAGVPIQEKLRRRPPDARIDAELYPTTPPKE
jgi:hypothetical protein